MSSDYDVEEVRSRVQAEVDALTDSQIRTFQHSRSAMENWIYRTARAIGRIISAPFRWIASLIEGFLDGLFGR
jgi:hypothetical protein